MPRIAYLGPQGTFTEAALNAMVDAGLIPGPPSGVELVPVISTPAALAAVRDGNADYACVPIENSIDGSVLPTLDALETGSPLQIFAELTLDVAFSIVVPPGDAHARRIATVAAFPVAAAQVRRWLAENLPDAEVVPAISNAGAALDVAEGRADAGVSTALAAQRYGLATLADGVVDEPNARTRFVLAGAPAPPSLRTGADRTSVVLWLANEPGGLAAALSELGMRGIDLTRIESRPTRRQLGTYVFFVDFIGHVDDEAVAEALKALYRRCSQVRYLGSWPVDNPDGVTPPAPDEADGWLAGLRAGRP